MSSKHQQQQKKKVNIIEYLHMKSYWNMNGISTEWYIILNSKEELDNDPIIRQSVPRGFYSLFVV
jgi:hypothetical protein